MNPETVLAPRASTRACHVADVGALVGWKFRAALVLGHVTAVDGEMLSISPISKPASQVRRKREKVLTEREMDRADVDEALRRHGHMPRTATKSRGATAQAIGLGTPSQARRARVTQPVAA